MAKHLLDAKKVEKARPRAKSYRLADGDGMYLYVPPSGVKAWQYRYRHAGEPQTATLGKLAYMPLSRARELAEEARKRCGRRSTHASQAGNEGEQAGAVC
jgi:Arm DNA-binding domain